MQIRKEEIKLPLFADNLIFYVEKFKEPTKKKNLLELIGQFSEVAGARFT